MKRNAPGLTIQGHFLKWIQKSPSVWRGFCLELMEGFVKLDPLHLLGCSLQKKYQPIHFFKNLIHFRLSINYFVITTPAILIRPCPEKNCIISCPVAYPDPIAQATYAPASIITLLTLALSEVILCYCISVIKWLPISSQDATISAILPIHSCCS